MLRIHFTGPDIDRVRVRTTPHPLWEALLSLHSLQTRTGGPNTVEWLRHVPRSLGPDVRQLVELAWPFGYSPDFLTPAVGDSSIDAAITALSDTAQEQLHRDISELAAARLLNRSTMAIGDGDTRALRQLGGHVATYHTAYLAPSWHRIRHDVASDAEQREQVRAESGIDRMLATLHPAIQWHRPVLHVDYPADQELRLNGRGIELIPSYFCSRRPIALKDPSLPPVLVYPATRNASRPGDSGKTPGAPDEALAALLGRTRAAILLAAAPGCTTTELAARLDISLANASQHVTVLRNAGLVHTQPHGATRFHTLTPLGAVVLGRDI